MNKKKYFNYFYVIPATLFVLVFVYFPIIMNFYNSLFRMISYSDTKTFVSFNHYIKMFNDPIFYPAIKNNVLYAVFSILFLVGFGMILAILLEGRFIGKRTGTFFRKYLTFTVIHLFLE